MDHVINRHLYADDDMLTTTQCAAAANLNRRTVLAWIHRGHLPAVRRAGVRGRYRIRWIDIYEAVHQPPLRRDDDAGQGSDGAAGGDAGGAGAGVG